MPKISNQKLKLITICKILYEMSDENNPMTIKDIQKELKRYDIQAERKSVSNDIQWLEEFGIDIIRTGQGCYIGQRIFELPELKILVNAIECSKFITSAKSRALINKIATLASFADAEKIKKMSIISTRVKSHNEDVYYNIDYIHNAIIDNKRLEFKLTKWNTNKKRVLKRDGKVYLVSPINLIWDDECYYLVAYQHDEEKMKHFRVDNMIDVHISDLDRALTEEQKNFDAGTYSKSVFNMYSGDLKRVKLKAKSELVGVFIDKFGDDIQIIPDGQWFFVNVDVKVSPRFYGWLFGFGEDCVIISPNDVKRDYIDKINKTFKNYR